MSEAGKEEGTTAQVAVGRSLPTKILYCSFCYKSQHEVKKLIAGPGGIFICDECVGLCNEIIAGCPISSTPSSPEELPTERLLERLGAVEETVQGKGNQLQSVVRPPSIARGELGANWSCLGYLAPIRLGAVYLSPLGQRGAKAQPNSN